MVFSLLDKFTTAQRRFEYDYIYFDAIFLVAWFILLIKKKKWSALKVSLFFSLIIYIIDAVFWWSLPAGANYPPGTHIREYWIEGFQLPRPLGDYFWLKFGCDFMMTISYGIITFSWLWIMFENYVKRNLKEILLFTCLYFGFWMTIPFLSFLIPWNDSIVDTIRHMDTQIIIWIINVMIGYGILSVIYGTKKFGRKDPWVIGYVFLVGCLASFIMEFPLFLAGIRPTGLLFVAYETIFLFNQGAPYLYIMYDKLFPWLAKKIKKQDVINKELDVIIKLD